MHAFDSLQAVSEPHNLSEGRVTMSKRNAFKFLSKIAIHLKRDAGHRRRTSRLHADKETVALADSTMIRSAKPSIDGRWALSDLPADVLLHILLHLDVVGVLNLAQASRLFHDLSRSMAIWRTLAFEFMCRSRRISLHDHLAPFELSAAQIRESVVLASAAEQSWLRAQARCIGGRAAKIMELGGLELDRASYVMKFASRRHLVLPTTGGTLVGWDTFRGCAAGSYEMGADAILVNVQGEYSSRSLYWITGRMSSDPEHAQNLRLTILRIQFPEPASTDPVLFEELAEIITPWSLASELHFLDAPRRMMCAVFACNDDSTTGLHVIFDWKTGMSFMFDTGIPYEYGRAVIGLHLSADGHHLVLHSENGGAEIRRSYALDPMRENATPWTPARDMSAPLRLISPASEIRTLWAHDPTAFAAGGDMTPHTVWVLPQWWPAFPGTPRRTSTIILYLNIERGEDDEVRKTWRAAQHYSVASGAEGEGQAGPCAPVRTIVDLVKPVLVRLGPSGSVLPVLAQSFNHLGWIEEYDDSRRSSSVLRDLKTKLRRKGLWRKEKRKRRALKLVTFPDPGVSPLAHRSPCTASGLKDGDDIFCDDCDCTTLKPVTLDVPEEVLNSTYHMFLDPAAGTITLSTEDNTLHVYQYGRVPPPIQV